MVWRKKIIKWIVAVLALLLLFCLPVTCTSRIKGSCRAIFAPLQKLVLQSGQSLKEGFNTVRGFGGLVEENHRLSEEVVRLQANLRVLKNLAEENLRLQRQLHFLHRQSRELIACRVFARTISDWWQSVQLDKGTREGIAPFRAVISSEGLVGRTDEVSPHTTGVLLISDPACKVSAQIARTKSFGVVNGLGVNLKGRPIARMRFIHKDTPIRRGDAVLTSGLGGVFPKDLLIGYVDAVFSEETGLYQYADIIPNAVVDLLDVVFVSSEITQRGEL